MNRPYKALLLPIALLAFVVVTSMGAQSCNGAGTVGTGVCLSCHDGVTASYKTSFTVSQHAGIECEACHGPGYAHVRNGGRGGLFIKNPARGSFEDSYAECADCHVGEVTGFLASKHGEDKVASCQNCHDVHKPGGERKSSLDNAMCLDCHAALGFGDDAAVEAHTVFHSVDPAGTGASRCVSCHMPPLDRVAQANGPHDHTLTTIPPIHSNDAAALGVTPIPPNSCSGIMGCHDGSVASAPVFDVDNLTLNKEVVQPLYELVGKNLK